MIGTLAPMARSSPASAAWLWRGAAFAAALAAALPAMAATRRGSSQDHIANQLNAQELHRVTGAYSVYRPPAPRYAPPWPYPPLPWYRPPPPYPPPPGWYPPP